MTLDFVREHLDKWLKYAKPPHNVDACACYHTAHGLAIMATDIAWELGDCKLSIAIDRLWDDTYRELFLQAYREELAQQ